MPDTPNIMSVRELIDTAFGESNINVVNHKLIQTILLILARQLRLLERRVEIEMGPTSLEISSETSLSITEVKLHANVPRKKKGKDVVATSPIVSGTSGSSSKGPTKTQTGTPTSGKVITKASAASYDKTSSSGTKSTTDKSSTEKSSSGVTSSATKSSTEKSSSDKTSSLKTSSDKTSSDKTTTEKSSSSKSKSASETTKSSTVTKSSSEKKTTTDETTSSTTKSTTEPTSTTKSSTEKSSSSAKLLPQDYEKMLEIIEEQRERELRTIHQRADSREEHDKTPTPMASLDSMERQVEKLLIVERVPTVETKSSKGRTQAGKTPKLSVVTQDEFAELAAIVRQLQDKFKTTGIPGFPENAQLLNDLRKGASLTDAMAALQLSARLEAAEKALEKMLSLVTDLASKTPGINLEELLEKTQGSDDDAEKRTEVIFGAKGTQSRAAVGQQTSTIGKESSSKTKKAASKSSSRESFTALSMTSKLPSETELDGEPEAVAPEEPKEKDTVTYEELDNALQEIYDECLKLVTTSTNRSNANANNALKIAHLLEGKLEESLNLGDRMLDLEKLVADYADQINILDTGLSSQMTNYQEQLTQMQHDLESGLEAMAEALANTGGDTAAVAELNNHFTNLQTDIDFASTRQKELKEMQDALSLNLQSLWKQIEILRDTKSDRDEVADALRDKAGLAALNGLVSRQEFDAVRGDFEKRIGSAYDKFNNQEIVWQKAIDDLIRELNEKADWIQMISLQGSINQYLDKFRAKIRAMEEVVGEPRAATVSRKLHREAECLSCSTPAHMDLEEPNIVPSLPAFPSSRPPAIGAEAKSQPKEDGDHGRICYPGLQVPHAIDPRAHICHRYCGGSHTLINNALSRAPTGMIITPALRKLSTAVGSDGRLYMVDEDRAKKPCEPCNYKKTTTPEPSETEPAPNQEDFTSFMTYEYRQSIQGTGASEISATPPPPLEED